MRKRALAACLVAGMAFGCAGEDKYYTLAQAAPLRMEMVIDDRPELNFLEGRIHTSLPYEVNGCKVRYDLVTILINGEADVGLMKGGGDAEDGKCLPASFDAFFLLRREKPTETVDVIEVWDKPEWKVRIEGVDIFEKRSWALLPRELESGIRVEGRWSHPEDELAGRIVGVRYLVDREIDDPAQGAFWIPGEEIEVEGSSFFFTIPEISGHTLGRLQVEVAALPLAVDCENAACSASLNATLHIDNIRINP